MVKFKSNFTGCLKLLAFSFREFYPFLNKTVEGTHKVLVAWNITIYHPGQEVVVISFFFPLMYLLQKPGVCWHSSSGFLYQFKWSLCICFCKSE